MFPAHESITELKRVSGDIALDFSNTADRREGEVLIEWLHDYNDLLAWGLVTGLLDDEQTVQLREYASRHPHDAEAALALTYHLRNAIYQIASHCAHGLIPDAHALDTLNSTIAEGAPYRRVAMVDGVLQWVWVLPTEGNSLHFPLWRIANAAGSLLTTQANKLRQCDGLDCGWLFLDTSRNHTRRWCDMSDCGNREKAKRHYRRAANRS